MAGNNTESKNALLNASKAKEKKAKNLTSAKVVQIEKDVKESFKNGTYGNMPTSFDAMLVQYGIPQTIRKKHRIDAEYGILKKRIEVCVDQIRNPPINPKVKKEYENEIARLEGQIKTLSGLNANLVNELELVSVELDHERKRNSNIIRQQAVEIKPSSKVTKLNKK